MNHQVEDLCLCISLSFQINKAVFKRQSWLEGAGGDALGTERTWEAGAAKNTGKLQLGQDGSETHKMPLDHKGNKNRDEEVPWEKLCC